jgi:hypothetical protein
MPSVNDCVIITIVAYVIIVACICGIEYLKERINK